MSSTNNFETSSSSSSDDDNGVKLIYRGAGIAAIIYELQRRKMAVARRWGGSTIGRVYLHRDRISAHETLMKDHFDENCTYPDQIFRRRFRMNRCVFLRIHDAIVKHDPTNFLQRRDAARKLGLSSLQKMTAVIRILAYGTARDSVDDYLKVLESTTLNSLKAFCTAVIEIFSDEYLRNPTKKDMERILSEMQEGDFQACLAVWIACIGNGKTAQLHGMVVT